MKQIGLIYIKNKFFFFCFLGLHPWHMQVPRLGVESEPQLTQRWILNPLGEARDQNHNLMDTSQIRFCCA